MIDATRVLFLPDNEQAIAGMIRDGIGSGENGKFFMAEVRAEFGIEVFWKEAAALGMKLKRCEFTASMTNNRFDVRYYLRGEVE